MKSTGSVRHVNVLGRIVIPKEIHRALRIRVISLLKTLTVSECYFWTMKIPSQRLVGL